MEKLRGKKIAGRRAFDRAGWIELKLEMIEERIVTDCVPLREWAKREAMYDNIEKYRYLDKGWRRISLGEMWGAEDHICFFRRKVVIPEAFDGKYVAMRMNFGGESMVYINGVAANGINVMREIVPLTERARAGESFDVRLISHVWSFPDDVRNEVDADEHIVQRADLIAVDKLLESAWYDLKVACDAAMALREANPQAHDFILQHLNDALMFADPPEKDHAAFRRSVLRAAAHARDTIYAGDVARPQGRMWMVGHSHLDIAFHWATKHGARKAARTTAVQIALMDEFPEFLFCQTQPQTYREMNESLVRQVLLGERFWKREFGAVSRTVFMPDVFGVSWILPQIMRRAGVEYFLTHKQSTWNDTNTFPHSLFWWQGIDGSRVLAVIPSSHFISQAKPEQLLENWTKWRQRREFPESLYCYGYGDGGGGATREMIEYGRRMKHMPGFPDMDFCRTEDYMDRALAGARELPVWQDELYLEAHRGTPTSKGHFKRWNRLTERAFREAELWRAVRMLPGGAYPQDRLNDGWDKVLTNQFHDIIPGSHTEQVAEEAYETFPRNLRIGEDVRADALRGLVARVNTAVRKGTPIVVFNSLPWRRTDVVQVTVSRKAGAFRIVDPCGEPVPYQVIGGSARKTEIVFLAENMPSVGYRTYRAERGEPGGGASVLRATKRGMESPAFRLRFDRSGRLTGVRDKRAGREVLAEGAPGNRFQIFEDRPGIYDAWDIIRFYKEEEFPLKGPVSIKVVECGPVRCVVRITRPILESTLTQDVILYAGLPRVEFRTHVDWKERRKLLKVGFPVAIHAQNATCDLDFGCIQRPTHATTSWDEAKFEVCAHKWIDLSEGGYGVSILNDCKYGHDVRGNLMRLTLLKGSVYPDEFADLGEHDFTYCLYPHEGDWRAGGTVRAGHELNAPLIPVVAKAAGGALPAEASFVQIDRPGVMLTALKKAEDSDDLVLRFVELHGARGPVTVRFAFALESVAECNLLEEQDEPVEHAGRTFAFQVEPYQIRTFKVRVSAAPETAAR